MENILIPNVVGNRSGSFEIETTDLSSSSPTPGSVSKPDQKNFSASGSMPVTQNVPQECQLKYVTTFKVLVRFSKTDPNLKNCYFCHCFDKGSLWAQEVYTHYLGSISLKFKVEHFYIEIVLSNCIVFWRSTFLPRKGSQNTGALYFVLYTRLYEINTWPIQYSNC